MIGLSWVPKNIDRALIDNEEGGDIDEKFDFYDSYDQQMFPEQYITWPIQNILSCLKLLKLTCENGLKVKAT